MLAGLLAGAAIPAVPYPRIMLSAHNAGFTVSGLLSMVAAFLLSSSLCSVSPRAAGVVIWAHIALWPLSLSEVAAILFAITAGRIFWGEQLLPTSVPLPSLGYPFLVLTLAGWIWTVLRPTAAAFAERG